MWDQYHYPPPPQFSFPIPIALNCYDTLSTFPIESKVAQKYCSGAHDCCIRGHILNSCIKSGLSLLLLQISSAFISGFVCCFIFFLSKNYTSNSIYLILGRGGGEVNDKFRLCNIVRPPSSICKPNFLSLAREMRHQNTKMRL